LNLKQSKIVHIKTLYKDFTSPDLALYWAKKTRMNPETDKFIDWHSLGDRAKQTNYPCQP